MAEVELLHSPVGTFRLPLPPSGTNDGYRLILHGRHPALMKSDELVAWEGRCREVLGAWRPPVQTALAVAITLEVPRELRRRLDVDSCVKFLVDLVVGKRRDQWVDHLTVEKVGTADEGAAVVLVRPYLTGGLNLGERI